MPEKVIIHLWAPRDGFYMQHLKRAPSWFLSWIFNIEVDPVRYGHMSLEIQEDAPDNNITSSLYASFYPDLAAVIDEGDATTIPGTFLQGYSEEHYPEATYTYESIDLSGIPLDITRIKTLHLEARESGNVDFDITASTLVWLGYKYRSLTGRENYNCVTYVRYLLMSAGLGECYSMRKALRDGALYGGVPLAIVGGVSSYIYGYVTAPVGGGWSPNVDHIMSKFPPTPIVAWGLYSLIGCVVGGVTYFLALPPALAASFGFVFGTAISTIANFTDWHNETFISPVDFATTVARIRDDYDPTIEDALSVRLFGAGVDIVFDTIEAAFDYLSAKLASTDDQLFETDTFTISTADTLTVFEHSVQAANALCETSESFLKQSADKIAENARRIEALLGEKNEHLFQSVSV